MRRSMTRQEKAEAEAAIYGLNQQTMSPIYTPEQIEFMKHIIAQHDGAKPGVIKEFDLNNPPKEPYVFKPYPKHMHDPEGRTQRIVQNKKDEDQAIKDGFIPGSLPAVVFETPEERSDAAEIEKLDKLAHAPKGTKA